MNMVMTFVEVAGLVVQGQPFSGGVHGAVEVGTGVSRGEIQETKVGVESRRLPHRAPFPQRTT